jgi:hypothetical protein
MSSHQGRAPVLDVLGILGELRGDERGGEFLPGHAGRLEQALVGRAEPSQLPLDELPDARRHPARSVLDRPAKLPVAVDLHQHALSDPILDDVDDEQRVATRPLMELAHQGSGDPVLGKRTTLTVTPSVWVVRERRARTGVHALGRSGWAKN